MNNIQETLVYDKFTALSDDELMNITGEGYKAATTLAGAFGGASAGVKIGVFFGGAPGAVVGGVGGAIIGGTLAYLAF